MQATASSVGISRRRGRGSLHRIPGLQLVWHRHGRQVVARATGVYAARQSDVRQVFQERRGCDESGQRRVVDVGKEPVLIVTAAAGYLGRQKKIYTK